MQKQLDHWWGVPPERAGRSGLALACSTRPSSSEAALVRSAIATKQQLNKGPYSMPIPTLAEAFSAGECNHIDERAIRSRSRQPG